MIVVWLFLTMPRVCLHFVIVVFPDHTHCHEVNIANAEDGLCLFFSSNKILCRYNGFCGKNSFPVNPLVYRLNYFHILNNISFYTYFVRKYHVQSNLIFGLFLYKSNSFDIYPSHAGKSYMTFCCLLNFNQN